MENATKEELEAHKKEFDSYERTSGSVNKLDYYKIYGWVMEHYSELSEAYPEIVEKYKYMAKEKEVEQTVVCSIDTEKGIFSITPFYNGDIQASLKIDTERGFEIRIHSNWKYRWIITNHVKSELWLTEFNLKRVLEEFERLLMPKSIKIDL